MHKPRWHSRRIVAGYLVAVTLLWLFLRNAEWRVLVVGLRSVVWSLLGAAITVRMAALVVSALRWQVLLAPVRRVRLGVVVMAMMMGMAVSALVSMQAAEVARPYWLSTRTETEFGATVATVAVEWFLDLLAVLALFIPVRGLAAMGAQAGWSDVNVAIALLAVVSVVGIAALRWVSQGLGGLRDWIHDSGVVPKGLGCKVVVHLEHFVVGLRILRRPKGLALVAAYSLMASLLTAVSAWLALLAFGLPVPFLGGFVVLGLITIGGMIPTPGAIGGFHAVCQFGLAALLKLDSARTVAPVIGLHAVLYIPPAAVGALCLLRARTEQERTPA